MAHPVMWFEVLGADGDGLRQFYGRLFGWKFDTNNPTKYGVVDTGDKRGIPGGVSQASNGARPWVTFYVETPDVTASLGSAERLGGKTLMETAVERHASSTLVRRHRPARSTSVRCTRRPRN